MDVDSKSLVESARFIWRRDPALGCTPEEYAKYLTDGDEAHLKLRGEPVRFRLVRLKRRQYIEVKDLALGGRHEAAAQLAAAYGVQGVDGLSIDGRPVTLERSGDTLSQSALDTLYSLHGDLITALGNHIFGMSDIGPFYGKPFGSSPG